VTREQQTSSTGVVILTGDLGELLRAETVCQRPRCALLEAGCFEEICHGVRLA
jgi:hypothetical protein